MIISAENQAAVASLCNDIRFQKLLADMEKERVSLLHSVLNAPESELSKARADLRAMTNLISEIKAAPAVARKIQDKQSDAMTVKPDRVT